jgi:hypothetical protein
MDSLIRLTRLADGDPQLQAQIQETTSASQLIALAITVGCEFTPSELRSRSRDLSAAYWPWAGKTHRWRRDWFQAD